MLQRSRRLVALVAASCLLPAGCTGGSGRIDKDTQ